jgi:16S rRNA (uracil1498-N3)-methyltransferase
MRITRFHCPDVSAIGQQIALPPQAAHHASRVLRMTVGDELHLFNGLGREFSASILRITKSEVVAVTTSEVETDMESGLHITLAQGISSGERMDFTLQKAVELGVTAIQPITAERSVVRLSGERQEKRRQHWQSVVVSACEQCGRSFVPEVADIIGLPEWLGSGSLSSRRLVLSPLADCNMKELEHPAESDSITLLVGPEGGLSESELKAAFAAGFQAIRLGPRILRTETAALAALAAMQTLWGDF